jgi:tRNA pseudouridine38-40 synthase
MAAINSRLPDDLVVVAAEPVAHRFDPIDQATSKAYSYTFHVARERPLWDRHYVHHVWDPRGLDVAAMQEAAAHLVGEHDFAAFAAAGHGRLSTVRKVFSCTVAEQALANERGQTQRARLEISGSGFLWNMVRIIAGTLMQVGLGQRTPADVAAILASRDRAKAGPTLAATGLCLEWIRYDGLSPGSGERSG